MKKQQYINTVVSSVLLLFIFTLVSFIVSCDDEDYRVIPEAEVAPTITSVEPSFGDIGSTITIIGANFSRVPANNRVSFNGIKADIVSVNATGTEIIVTVPEDATTGPVSIFKAKLITEGPIFQIVPAPEITDLSTTGAAVGETINIIGLNFSEIASENTVQFNGITTGVVAATTTELTVIVPEKATTGPLTVEVLGQIATVDVFTIAPTITSFEPLTGTFSDVITIRGNNFSLSKEDNLVSFNGIPATILSATRTELVVTVPAEANSGKIAVEVENLLATSSTDFITVPSIVSFTPDVGTPGTEVVIEGGNFSSVASNNIVNFNGVLATVTESTVTSITTTVPAGATTGTATIEVDDQIGTSTTDFIVDNSIVSIAVSIEVEEDDVEESTLDGEMDLTSGDLELGELDSGAFAGGTALPKIGLRFNNVNIPQGSPILGATIQFRADNTGSSDTEMTIYAEAIDNASAYTVTAGDLSARALTTANAIWNVPPWLSTGDRLPAQQTVDLSNVIQEVINRPGWVSGNSINIVMIASGVSASPSSTSVGREAEGFSTSNPQNNAELNITFRTN